MIIGLLERRKNLRGSWRNLAKGGQSWPSADRKYWLLNAVGNCVRNGMERFDSREERLLDGGRPELTRVKLRRETLV